MRVAVRVRPGAKSDTVGGRWDGPRGTALLVAVRARAVEGAANAAVIAAVAAAFGLRRGDVELISGARSRDKLLALTGSDSELSKRLTQLLS